MAGKARPIYWPPADIAKRQIPITSIKSSKWYRLHPDGLNPIYFSKNEGNRYSALNSSSGALYVGADLETCLMEIYGDRIYGFQQRGEQVVLADADWHTRRAASLTIPPLQLCDFTDRKTLQECGVDAASLMAPDLAVPQAWGAAIMNHPRRFDGIRFVSRFTHARCLAIFDRVGGIAASGTLGPISKLAEGDHLLNHFKIALV